MDRCARWLHTYYKMKRNAPEFFTNRDVYSDEVQTALKDQIYLALPITPDNCNVFLHKLSDFEPRKWIFDATIKTFIMTAGKTRNSKLSSEHKVHAINWWIFNQRLSRSATGQEMEQFSFMTLKAEDFVTVSSHLSVPSAKALTFSNRVHRWTSSRFIYSTCRIS